MGCLNYKKGLTCINYKCQFGYINCANFQCDMWDSNKCQNYDLQSSATEAFGIIQYLNTIGVSYKNKDGSFKRAYEVLEEISDKYKDAW